MTKEIMTSGQLTEVWNQTHDDLKPLLPFLKEYVIETIRGKLKLTKLVFYIPEGVMKMELNLEKIKGYGFNHLEIENDWRRFPSYDFIPIEPILQGREFTLSYNDTGERMVKENKTNLKNLAK